MIEPTEEMVEAYRVALRKRAQELIDDVQLIGAQDMTAYGLAAAFELVERDVVQPLRDLLAQLVDTEPCWFDHDGCQAHGFLSLEPGEKCPHAQAKELLGLESTS